MFSLTHTHTHTGYHSTAKKKEVGMIAYFSPGTLSRMCKALGLIPTNNSINNKTPNKQQQNEQNNVIYSKMGRMVNHCVRRVKMWGERHPDYYMKEARRQRKAGLVYPNGLHGTNKLCSRVVLNIQMKAKVGAV